MPSRWYSRKRELMEAGTAARNPEAASSVTDPSAKTSSSCTLPSAKGRARAACSFASRRDRIELPEDDAAAGTGEEGAAAAAAPAAAEEDAPSGLRCAREGAALRSDFTFVPSLADAAAALEAEGADRAAAAAAAGSGEGSGEGDGV